MMMLLLMMIDWRVWGSRVDVTPPSGSKLQFWSNLGGSEKYGSRGRFSWTSGVNENIQFSKQEARQERDCNSFKTVFKTCMTRENTDTCHVVHSYEG